MVLALCPNSSVDLVSSLLVSAGEQQMTIVVLAFPPSDSYKDCFIILDKNITRST